MNNLLAGHKLPINRGHPTNKIYLSLRLHLRIFTMTNNNNNNNNNKSNNKIVRNLILIKSKRELELTKRVIDPVFCFFPPGFSPTADQALSRTG